MTGALQVDDLRRILDAVHAARAGGPPPEGLPEIALQQLAHLVPCDLVSFTDFDVASGVVHVDQDCIDGRVTITVNDRAEPDDPFFRHYAATASCSYPTTSGDDVTVIKRSDFYSDAAWRRTPMYVDFFAGTGLDNEIICCLPTQGTRSRRLIFFRSGSVDFDEHDRLVLALLRPHLSELHALGLRARTPEPDLTARQWELLRLVAAGHTNAEIASRLFVTSNTVRKHLENIFERLQVSSRTAAVGRAFPERFSA